MAEVGPAPVAATPKKLFLSMVVWLKSARAKPVAATWTPPPAEAVPLREILVLTTLSVATVLGANLIPKFEKSLIVQLSTVRDAPELNRIPLSPGLLGPPLSPSKSRPF